MNQKAFEEGWRLVAFPSEELRLEFLAQVRLWNRVDGLPPIEVEPTGDPGGLRLRSGAGAFLRVGQLVMAYGGYVLDDPEAESRTVA